jgi:hypothetical protein
MYPVIDREEFQKICNTWQVRDDRLKTADIDRCFIATNVEIEENDANDDLALCRFEFFEIVVRLSKVKFLDSKLEPSLSSAVRRMMKQHVQMFNPVPFGVDWFERTLATPEVNELLRVNLDGLTKCFQHACGSKKYLSLVGACQFLLNLKDFPGQSDHIGVAYAFAK